MSVFMVIDPGTSGSGFGEVIFGQAERRSWQNEYGAVFIRLA